MPVPWILAQPRGAGKDRRLPIALTDPPIRYCQIMSVRRIATTTATRSETKAWEELGVLSEVSVLIGDRGGW
jgi:hypothetical protein